MLSPYERHIGESMSNAIETIKTVKVSDAQAKAIRKLALRNSKFSAEQFAQLVFDRAVKNSFSPLVKSIATDAMAKYKMAISGGFPAPTYKTVEKDEKTGVETEVFVTLTAEEYAKRAAVEYRDILSELGE